MTEQQNNWTVVMVYPKEVESIVTAGHVYTRYFGQKCADTASLRLARIFIEETCKVAFPKNEYLVVPYTDEKFAIEIEHRYDMWTFNAKGEARPAWFRVYHDSDDADKRMVGERIKSDPCPNISVGDLVRIELTHHNDHQRNMVRRVLAVHRDEGYCPDGSRTHGLIDYEIDYELDTRMPDYSDGRPGEYHNSCNISWVTEIVERSFQPQPVINHMHEHWKRSSLNHKEYNNRHPDRVFGRAPIHDPFYDERPIYDVRESARYILNRQATIALEDHIDWDKMHAQLLRDMYPGCHFVEVGWSDFKRMHLHVKQWKKFRKGVLKNHRKWVTALKATRVEAIEAAKAEEKRQMDDMDSDYDYLYRNRDSEDENAEATDEGSCYDDDEDRVSDYP